jgi:hypothetical protein
VLANAFIALKIVPSYMDYRTVQQVVNSTIEELKKKRLPNKKVRGSIERKLLINGIRDLKHDDLIIKQSNEKSTITMDYEVRKPIFYNIDAVMSFKYEAEAVRGNSGQ